MNRCIQKRNTKTEIQLTNSENLCITKDQETDRFVFQIFCYNLGKESGQLHQGIRHTEVRYIEVPLGCSKQQLKNSSLCIGVPTIEFYWAIYRSFQYFLRLAFKYHFFPSKVNTLVRTSNS